MLTLYFPNKVQLVYNSVKLVVNRIKSGNTKQHMQLKCAAETTDLIIMVSCILKILLFLFLKRQHMLHLCTEFVSSQMII